MALTDKVVGRLSGLLGERLDGMQRQLVAVLVGVALLGVIALRALFVLAISILQPVKEMAQVAKRLAQGDLSVPVEVRNSAELGELEGNLEETRRAWADIVSHMQHAAQAIWTASEQIRTGNNDLGQRTGATVGSLQQTASSVGQLTASVAQTSDAAQEANALANGAASAARHGGEIVAQVVTGMQDIEQASRKISEIIGTIDGIAFQTNILALNAAVEAARAGEQGRGFAVVANEVRTLAQRSAQAAREIKSLISSSGEKVSSGVTLVQEAGTSMQDIVGRVQRVTDMINGITGAAMEQSSGIGLVNEAVSNLDSMAQRNAELVEQSGAAAQDLNDQAQRLRDMAHRFRLA
jgi:methyl-accepting chemotaxis protein